MIYCLMAAGAPLTDAIRTHLFTVAREMVAKGRTKQKFRNDDCEGCVYTNGEWASMATISGVYFTAVVETGQVNTKVKFIVPSGELADLDQAKWYDLFPQWNDGPSLN